MPFVCSCIKGYIVGVSHPALPWPREENTDRPIYGIGDGSACKIGIIIDYHECKESLRDNRAMLPYNVDMVSDATL